MSNDDRQFLRDFYKALDRPIVGEDPRYVDFFEDPGHADGHPMETIFRKIAWSEHSQSIQVLAAGPGCGLSTELSRLGARLRDSGFNVFHTSYGLGSNSDSLSSWSHFSHELDILHEASLEEPTHPRDAYLVKIFGRPLDLLDLGEIHRQCVGIGGHFVLTVPLSSVLLRRAAFEQRVNGVHVLPNVKLREFESDIPIALNRSVFKSMIEKRGDWQRLLGTKAMLDRLIDVSGGNPGTPIDLLRQLVERVSSLPVGAGFLSYALNQARERLTASMDSEDLVRLSKLSRNDLTLDEIRSHGAARWIDSGVILHYQSNGVDWFRVHPIFEGRFQQASKRPIRSKAKANQEQEETLPTDRLSLEEIRIGNIRVFEDFQLDLQPTPEPSTGQWTLLIGDNGVGKTTLLRSLVLALVDSHTAGSLFQLGSTAPFLRSSEQVGELEVLLNGERFYSEISQGHQGLETVSSSVENTPSLPIYAYGCQRGTALGGPARDVELRPLDAVRSLFDDSARLIHAETWLQNLRLAALESRGGADEVFFEALRRSVAAVLAGVESLDVDKDGAWLTGPSVGTRVPLAALSDGYVTTLGWVLDLVARWSHRARRLGAELDGDFRERMTGLVLIDEIDLHLHPRWQVEILEVLRNQFPMLSVVATTHNPMTLIGARPGEIHVLRRDETTGAVEARQRDIPKGARADQVLTGDWFGLPSTVDHETRELLARHRELLRQGVDREAPDRRKLEDELRRRLGTYADTSEDRLALSVAAELMDDDFDELSPDERRVVREKVLLRVKERIAEKAG